MSHVDEGTLHAYLDGELETVRPGSTAALEAHIAACDECRARLEDERRVRDRARVVLDHATPAALEMPPFDAVLDRAHRTTHGAAGATHPRRRSFTLPLAWAASIALALAGGWWARELALRAPPARSLAVQEVDLDAFTDAAAPTQAAPDVGAGQAAAAPADAAAKTSAATQAGPAREPERSVEAGPARPAVDVSTAATTLQRRRAIADTDAPQRADSATRARISAFAVPPAADSGGVVAEPRLSTLTVTADPALAPAAPAAVVAQWSTVDRAEAERRLGGSLLLVDGLEIQSIEVADTAGLPLVRTRQTVAPGVALVVLQHAAPRATLAEAVIDEARAAPPVAARPGASSPVPAELVLERSGFLVTLRAAVPQDSLRALAGRLR